MGNQYNEKNFQDLVDFVPKISKFEAEEYSKNPYTTISFTLFKSIVSTYMDKEDNDKKKLEIIGNWCKLAKNPNQKNFDYIFKQLQDQNSDLMKDLTNNSLEINIRDYHNKKKDKFKDLLMKGPPECFQWVAWLISNNVPERNMKIYYNYQTIELDRSTKNNIIRDYEVTFANLKESQGNLKIYKNNLYNILKAFLNLDKDIKYEKELNILVGFMLVIAKGNDLDVFYFLITLLSSTFSTRKKNNEYSLRGLFTEDYPLLIFFNYIFKSILDKNFPDIKTECDKSGVKIDEWTNKWIQTLFTDILPIPYCRRLWDYIFSDGIYFLIKFAIEIIRTLYVDILEKITTLDSARQYFEKLQKNALAEDFIENKEKFQSFEDICTRALKIKINPEEYLKLFRKSDEENFGKFSNLPEKIYELKEGNENLIGFKIEHRNTVLFNDAPKDLNKKKIEKPKTFPTVYNNTNLQGNIKDRASMFQSNNPKPSYSELKINKLDSKSQKIAEQNNHQKTEIKIPKFEQNIQKPELKKPKQETLQKPEPKPKTEPIIQNQIPKKVEPKNVSIIPPRNVNTQHELKKPTFQYNQIFNNAQNTSNKYNLPNPAPHAQQITPVQNTEKVKPKKPIQYNIPQSSQDKQNINNIPSYHKNDDRNHINKNNNVQKNTTATLSQPIKKEQEKKYVNFPKKNINTLQNNNQKNQVTSLKHPDIGNSSNTGAQQNIPKINNNKQNHINKIPTTKDNNKPKTFNKYNNPQPNISNNQKGQTNSTNNTHKNPSPVLNTQIDSKTNPQTKQNYSNPQNNNQYYSNTSQLPTTNDNNQNNQNTTSYYTNNQINENSNPINDSQQSTTNQQYINPQVSQPESNILPLSQPQYNQLPSNDPQLTQLPSSQPQYNQLPSNDPQLSQLPSSQPQYNQLSSNNPQLNQLPSNDPQLNQLPSSQSQYNQVPSTDPQLSQLPSSQPQYNQLPSTDPQLTQLPSSQSQYNQLPSTDPQLSQLPSSQPQYDQSQYNQSQSTDPQYNQLPSTEPQYNQSQSTDTQYNQPQTTDPQYNQPQTTDPQYTQPQTTDPQYNHTQTTEPQYNQSQYNQTQSTEPQYNQLPSTEPQYNQSVSTDPQLNQSQSTQPLYTQPQYNQTQSTDPQYNQQQYNQTQSTDHQYNQPQYNQSQSTEPQYNQNVSTDPHLNQTQSTQPQYTQPQYNQTQSTDPQLNQSQSTQPQYTQPQYNQTQSTDPQYNQPQYNQSQVSDPLLNQSQSTQPQYTQPQSTDPQLNQNQYTQSQYTNPQYTQPQSTDPQLNQNQYTQPQYTQSQYTQPGMTQSQYTQPQTTQPQTVNPSQPIYAQAAPDETFVRIPSSDTNPTTNNQIPTQNQTQTQTQPSYYNNNQYPYTTNQPQSYYPNNTNYSVPGSNVYYPPNTTGYTY